MNKKEIETKTLIVVFIGAVALFILKIDTILDYLEQILKIIIPFFYGVIFAYIMAPFCNKVQKRLCMKHPT